MKELSYKNISLSLIIPVFNEEQSVQAAIESNLYALNQQLTQFEIIVVNDGSDDSSQEIINQFIKDRSNISSIQKEKNEGIGSAIRTGIYNAKYDYVFPVPVDCPLDNETLSLFLSQLGNADVIAGYRPKRVGYSVRMRMNSYLFHAIISFLFNVKLKDYNWIHLYKRKIFIKDGIEITSNGIVMLAEVLIKSLRKGLSVKEIEVVQRERLTGIATASKFTTLLKTFKEIISLYREIG